MLVTRSDRESALIFGLLLWGLGAGWVWLCIKQFKDPVDFTNAVLKRVGADHLPEWLRPNPAAYPRLVRVNAAVCAAVGILFCALAGWMLISALAR